MNTRITYTVKCLEFKEFKVTRVYLNDEIIGTYPWKKYGRQGAWELGKRQEHELLSINEPTLFSTEVR